MVLHTKCDFDALVKLEGRDPEENEAISSGLLPAWGHSSANNLAILPFPKLPFSQSVEHLVCARAQAAMCSTLWRVLLTFTKAVIWGDAWLKGINKISVKFQVCSVVRGGSDRKKALSNIPSPHFEATTLACFSAELAIMRWCLKLGLGFTLERLRFFF